VGRVVAFNNSNYISYSGENVGFFGFFESVDDDEVAQKLFDKVAEWGRMERLDAMVGPVNYTVSDSCGILIEGFDKPPMIGMPYNKPYYATLMEKCGGLKRSDLVAYKIPSTLFPESLQRHARIAERQMARDGIVIRPFDMRKFDRDTELFHQAYNKAFAHNWGFVPLTAEEFRYQAEGLKKIADTDLVLFAEHQGEVVGFICGIPNINEVLIRIPRGRLFPFGVFKFLLYKRRINTVRVTIMGVTEEFRNKGIDVVLYKHVFNAASRKGVHWAEASYVMENNTVMHRIMQLTGAEVYKRYRIYELGRPHQKQK
jgi:GNAT superfamily N-acetyltransferase